MSPSPIPQPVSSFLSIYFSLPYRPAFTSYLPPSASFSSLVHYVICTIYPTSSIEFSNRIIALSLECFLSCASDIASGDEGLHKHLCGPLKACLSRAVACYSSIPTNVFARPDAQVARSTRLPSVCSFSKLHSRVPCQPDKPWLEPRPRSVLYMIRSLALPLSLALFPSISRASASSFFCFSGPPGSPFGS